MSKPKFGGPKLPKALLEQVQNSLPQRKKQGSQKPSGYLPKTRKEKRKLDRHQAKQANNLAHGLERRRAFKKPPTQEQDDAASLKDESEFESFSDEDRGQNVQTQEISAASNRPPKKIPSQSEKHHKAHNAAERQDMPKKLSRVERERLAEDDAEIAKFEKKLGIKNKKVLPKSFSEDGLDALLGDLGAVLSSDDEFDSQSKRKRDNEVWLKQKRRKFGQAAIEGLEPEKFANISARDENNRFKGEVDSEDDTESVGEWEDEDEEGEENDENSDQESDSGIGESVIEKTPKTSSRILLDADDNDFDDGESSSENVSEQESAKVSANYQNRIRENPFVPPLSAQIASTAKYVPPSRRAQAVSDNEANSRLTRQTQGLLNRLSDANILSILSEIETLYQKNARQFVTSALIDLLLNLLADESALSDNFIILHASFIAAVFKVIGTDFGAQLIEELTTRFDRFYKVDHSDSNTKQLTNLVSLLSQLYIFQVIGPELVFDFIRLFLSKLSELHTELLLRIIKFAGAQLRQDDPSSMKDIVIMLQRSVSQANETSLSVRTRFMVETIDDLKNNRLKAGVVSSAIAMEHIARMKKTLGSLNTRNLKATEALHIGLNDIRDSEKRGKWWLVGASWKGREANGLDGFSVNQIRTGTKSLQDIDRNSVSSHSSMQNDDEHDDSTTDIPILARKLGMNTTIRKSIFVILLTSSDYKNAYVRLMKLHLNRKQEGEIPRVLIRCATAENSYNAYYTLIAKRLCSEKRLRMMFQFALWDFFKQCEQGAEEMDDADDDSKNSVGMSVIVNYAKLYADLIIGGAIGIDILKTLDFVYLIPKLNIFTEVLLVTILSQAKHTDTKSSGNGVKALSSKLGLKEIFDPTPLNPQLKAGLQFFLKNTVMGTDLTSGNSEKMRIKKGCADVRKILETTADSEN